jgi:hypothetical protein
LQLKEKKDDKELAEMLEKNVHPAVAEVMLKW